MILSRYEIRRAVEDRAIGFSPELEESQWGEASIDLRLGFSFTTFKKSLTGITISVADGLKTVGDIGLWQSRNLKERDANGKRENFVLDPNEFVLALTYESVKVPTHLIALVEGRSTYARVGISMHQTAPWIQPGWSGQITLEIKNNGTIPISLTPMVDRPCQLTFFELKSELLDGDKYGAKPADRYQNQQHPLQHDRA